MDVDMSLDEMITADRKTKQSNRRAGRGGKAAAPAAAAAAGGNGGARARYAGAAPANGRQAAAAAKIQAGNGQAAPQGEAFKIIVSNLPLDVDDAAVKDLFDSTIGRTKECFLTYDKNGKHKGVATVVFQARGAAPKAFQTYNNRLVDGRTPMKVELVYTKPPPTLASRVAPVAAPAAPAAAARGPAKPRRGGRNGAAKPADSGRRPKKTQEDLDAEMDSWKTAEPAAAAPATE